MSSEGESKSSLRVRVVRGLSWSFVQTWASHAITFIVFLIIARLLGPEDFGTVAIAYVVLGALVALVDMGLCDAAIRLRHAGQAHFDAAFWSIVAFSLLLFAVLAAAAQAIAAAFDQPPLATLMWIVGMALPVSALGLVQAAVLRKNMRFKELAVRTLVATSAGGVVGVSLAVAGFGYWSLVVKGLVDAAASTALVWRASPYRPRLSFERSAWLELFASARHLLASRAVEIAAQRVDSIIVSARLGAGALGLYAAGQRVYMSMMEVLYTTIQRVALPAFSEIASDAPRTRQALLRMVTITSFFTIPLFAFTAALADPLVPVLFGAKWSAAAPVLAWYSVAGVLFSVSYFNASLMVAAGRTDFVFFLTIANTSLNIIGFLIGVHWGIAGVAAAFAIRGYVLLPVNLLFLRRAIGLPSSSYVRTLLPNLTTTLLAVAIVLLVAEMLPAALAPAARLAILIVTAVAAQCACASTITRRSTIQVLVDLRQMTHPYPRVAGAIARCERLLNRAVA